jgi:hypothetical protein
MLVLSLKKVETNWRTKQKGENEEAVRTAGAQAWHGNAQPMRLKCARAFALRIVTASFCKKER